MKNFFFTKLTVLLFLCLLLCSCSFIEIVEIDERLIITALGIDLTDEGYEVCVQALNTSQSSSGSSASSGDSGSSSGTTLHYSLKGETVGDALIKLYTITGLKPLYSQARILVLGKRAAQEKLSQSLDFFLREYATRTDILIALSLTTAKDVVSASYGSGNIGANLLEETVKSGEYTGKSITMPLYKFINLISGETDCAYCPVVGTEKNEFSEDMIPVIEGTALFKNGKYKFTINDDETMGLMMLTNQIGGASIPIETENGLYNLGIVASSSEIKTDITNNRLSVQITTKIRCDIVEYENPDFSAINEEDIAVIKQAAEKLIEKRLEATLKKTFFEGECDICRFGKITMLKNWSFYNTSIKNCDYSDKTDTQISVKIKVRRVGKESLYY